MLGENVALHWRKNNNKWKKKNKSCPLSANVSSRISNLSPSGWTRIFALTVIKISVAVFFCAASQGVWCDRWEVWGETGRWCRSTEVPLPAERARGRSTPHYDATFSEKLNICQKLQTDNNAGETDLKKVFSSNENEANGSQHPWLCWESQSVIWGNLQREVTYSTNTSNPARELLSNNFNLKRHHWDIRVRDGRRLHEKWHRN